MKLGIPKESAQGESRVAASPESVGKLIKLGFEVSVEKGAGVPASFSDEDYQAAGANLTDAASIWTTSDLVTKVQAPSDGEISQLKSGANLISFVWPAQNEGLLAKLNEKKITTLAMDCVPRISRAQKLDALSSMANVSGYKAVLEAATQLKGFFPGQVTAAGRIRPAEVLVIGAGVAGLAAIAAARSLGAIVRAFDVRSSVREQIESLGAEFLEVLLEEEGEGEGGYAKEMSERFLEEEMRIFAEQAERVDVIITTALIPGKPAPKLITAEMVKSMKPGSVIVDLAAERGGNCELTVPHERANAHGVSIIGYTDFPSRMSTQSSALYAGNIAHLLDDMVGDEGWALDLEDDVVRGCMVTHEGETTWPPPKPKVAPPKPEAKPEPEAKPAEKAPVAPPKEEASKQPEKKEGSSMGAMAGLAVLGAILIGLSSLDKGSPLVQEIIVFVMACIVGWHVIWNVTPALHTPLMSVTNAISGIILVGGMLQVSDDFNAATYLGAGAILVATINIAGGFLVTHRMLKMFRKG